MSTSKMLYIDLDGTLTNEPNQDFNSFHLSTPKKEVISKVNECFDLGFQIIIYTSRYKEDLNITIKWLKKNKVKYHDIIFNKPLGLFYIDDKNLSINSFLNKKF